MRRNRRCPLLRRDTCAQNRSLYVRKEKMIKGPFLRTLSDAWSVLAGTLARVETVGRTWQGEFVFTVRWLNWRIRTQSRPVSDRSLNLWEQDLAQFEVVSRRDCCHQGCCSYSRSFKAKAVGLRYSQSKIKTTNLDQLRLFTLEDL